MLKLLFFIFFVLSASGCLGDGSDGVSPSSTPKDVNGLLQGSAASNNADLMLATWDVDPAIGSAVDEAPARGITTYHNPEPNTMLMLIMGLGGILAARRKKGMA